MKVPPESPRTVTESTVVLSSLGEVTEVGDTGDAENATSSLSASALNGSFEGSMGTDDLGLTKNLPLVEISSA